MMLLILGTIDEYRKRIDNAAKKPTKMDFLNPVPAVCCLLSAVWFLVSSV
jgi:hypothetical protein